MVKKWYSLSLKLSLHHTQLFLFHFTEQIEKGKEKAPSLKPQVQDKGFNEENVKLVQKRKNA